MINGYYLAPEKQVDSIGWARDQNNQVEDIWLRMEADREAARTHIQQVEQGVIAVLTELRRETNNRNKQAIDDQFNSYMSLLHPSQKSRGA